MKKAVYTQGEDFLSFDTPIDENDQYETWMVHVNFLLSNWTCIYGEGCPGLTPANESRYHDDIGCCKMGCWFTEPDDYDKTERMVAQLTADDWDDEKRKHVEKNGWSNVYSRSDEEINAKTKVVDQGCVFHNRSTGSVGSTGKTGCAFHHLAARTGQDHVDVMPHVCWQLPLKYVYNEDMGAHVIHPWDIDQWGDGDDDGTHNTLSCWWCVDSPEAYVGDNPVYVSMEHELRTMMTDAVYEQMVPLLEARKSQYVAKMPGSIINGGRPLLPLLIGNRTPYRSPSATNTPNIIANMKREADANSEATDQHTTG